MHKLKSIKLYFFSILKLSSLSLRNYYFTSHFYNKKLITFIPDRINYSPSSHLSASLTTVSYDFYKITDTSLEELWKTHAKDKQKFKNLHSFLWLTKVDRKNSKTITQSIINSWINKYDNYDIKSWGMEITAKRIIAWTSNTDIVLHESDNMYKQKIFISLIKQSNFLLRNIKYQPYDTSRIICVSAVILSGLIFKEAASNLKFGINELEKIIATNFDKSGFPKSRNPEDVFIYIKYLVLVREWLKEAHEPLPEFLNSIILKCGKCYNFLTNSHKKFPLFNGASEINHDKYDIFLKTFKYKFKCDENEIGGLFKTTKNKIELFFDAGNPPPDKFSNSYQAGCLAFELISKGKKIICNTGYAKHLDSKFSLLSRSTAAHSTLYLNDSSSSLFQKNIAIKKVYGNSLIQSHKILEKKLIENEKNYHLFATHNGYEKKYGYLHKRSINILKKESKIYGTDELQKTKKKSNIVYYFIRFHIYPGIKIVKTKGGNSVLMSLPNGEGWLLKATENNLDIEKNIFLGRKKIINNECICISGSTNNSNLSINWQIEKVT